MACGLQVCLDKPAQPPLKPRRLFQAPQILSENNQGHNRPGVESCRKVDLSSQGIEQLIEGTALKQQMRSPQALCIDPRGLS